jgi:hypothetical protein
VEHRDLQGENLQEPGSRTACHAEGRGFESHQPLGSPCKSTIFFFPGSSIEVLTIMQKVPGWDVLNELGTLSARAWSPSAAPGRHFSRQLTIG